MSTRHFKTHTMRVPSLLTRLFMRHVLIIFGHSTTLDWNIPHLMTFVPSFAKICQILKKLEIGDIQKTLSPSTASISCSALFTFRKRIVN